METPALTFAEPAWFLVLAVLPFFAAIYWWSMRRSQALISRIVAPRLREQLAGSVSFRRRGFKAALMIAALAFLIAALARPQMGFVQKEVTARGRDVIIAIDTSRSMLATDISPTRLARAKLVAQDLLRQLKGDRVGLVAFAGSAFLQAPLTLDESAVLASLDELDTSVIPKGGTNIGAAIRTSEEAFGKAEGKTRALVILTDGEELDADGIAAAKTALEHGIRVFTVGIGSSEGSLIPLRGESGGSDFVRDSEGKPVQSKLDENRLREIAEAGGGFYQPLNSDAAKMIFEKGILPIEKSDTGTQSSRQPVEQYQWPLGAAIALLIAWMIVGDRRRAARPARKIPTPVAAALLLIALAAPAFAQGFKEYEAKNYQQALSDFEKNLQQSPESHERQFDVAAAAYQTGDYAKAVDLFTKAMLSEEKSLRENASYNLANSLVRRGEAAKEKDKESTKSDWKNAIQHYDEVLKLDPANRKAQENRDIVKKMLEDLEKEQKQDQNQQKNQDKNDQQKQDQDQQKQDQKNQDQKNQDQQKKEDQKNDEQKNQQQNQDRKNGQDQKQQQGQSGDEKKDDQQQGKNQQDKNDQSKDGKGEKGDEKQDQQQQQQDKGEDEGRQEMAQNKSDNQGKPAPTPAPTPGEKKEGELKSGDQQQEQQQQQNGQQGQAAAQEAEEREGEMSAAQARGLLNSLRGDEERVRLMLRADDNQVTRDW